MHHIALMQFSLKRLHRATEVRLDVAVPAKAVKEAFFLL